MNTLEKLSSVYSHTDGNDYLVNDMMVFYEKYGFLTNYHHIKLDKYIYDM